LLGSSFGRKPKINGYYSRAFMQNLLEMFSGPGAARAGMLLSSLFLDEMKTELLFIAIILFEM
jgi:hypothetical protein